MQINDNDLVSLIDDLENLEHTHRDKLSYGFNMFEAAGVGRYEIRHSKILAFLLNPSEQHGLGDYLLKLIIKEAAKLSRHHGKPNQLELALGDFDDVIVRTEDMRIDILAWSERNKIVTVIENKIDAGEGKDQLPSYRKKIENDTRFKEFRKLYIYLTQDGDQPSDSEWWVPVSYEVLLEYLNETLQRKSSFLSSDSRLFVTHYIDLVRRVILKDIDQKLIDDCLEVYYRHKQVFEIVIDNIPSQYVEAIEAITKFVEAHDSEITIISKPTNRLVFLTKSLMEKVPEGLKDPRWIGKERCIAFWFDFTDEKVKLAVHVGPMNDQGKRVELIKKLYLEISSNSRKEPSGTYSQVWGKTRTINDPQKMGEFMESLYKEMLDQEIPEKVEKILNEVFPKV